MSWAWNIPGMFLFRLHDIDFPKTSMNVTKKKNTIVHCIISKYTFDILYVPIKFWIVYHPVIWRNLLIFINR